MSAYPVGKGEKGKAWTQAKKFIQLELILVSL